MQLPEDVLWAQRPDAVYLTIDLKEVQDIKAGLPAVARLPLCSPLLQKLTTLSRSTSTMRRCLSWARPVELALSRLGLVASVQNCHAEGRGQPLRVLAGLLRAELGMEQGIAPAICCQCEAPIAKDESKWSTKRLCRAATSATDRQSSAALQADRVLSQEADGGELDKPQQGQEASLGKGGTFEGMPSNSVRCSAAGGLEKMARLG